MKTDFKVGSISAVTLALLSENDILKSFLEPITSFAEAYVDFPGASAAAVAICGFLFGAIGSRVIDRIRWMLLRKLLTYIGWITNPKSTKTKIYGILMKLLSPTEADLFDFQKVLPPYPLPKLEDTCERTLETVRPMLTDGEYKLVEDALNELKNGDGPELQKVLEKRYATEENWFADIWEKYAYLSARCALPINLNYAMLSQLNISGATQCSRAANYTYYIMKYKQLIESEKMSPLKIMDLIPICMDRYKSLYSVTRLPGETMDELKYYKNTNHIAVFRNGHCYILDMLVTNDLGKKVLMSPYTLQKIYERIITMSDSEFKMNPNPFTSMERPQWFKKRCELMEDPTNASNIEIIESAAFCVSLDKDDNHCTDPGDLCHQFLTGNAYHRWFDKSFVLVARENSAIGLNCEHTTAEATLYGRMWEYVICHQKYDAEHNAITFEGLDDSLKNTPRELSWNIDQYKEEIVEINQKYDALRNNVDCCVHMTTKGKGIMKSHRVGPDGFIQMAMQVAWYRMHKSTPKTYETGTTRLFNKGRTETIRPVSKHSKRFAMTFDDPTISVSDKVKYMKDAIAYQTKYKYNAMQGKGIDRHLFGLYIAGNMIGKPLKLFGLKPFTDYDELSTSQSPVTYDKKIMHGKECGCAGGGFGPQHPEGYGVAYFIIGENKIHLVVSCYKSWKGTSAKKFAVEIEKAIDDQIQLLDDAIAIKKKVANGANNN